MTNILAQTPATDDRIVHPAWCDLEGHSLTAHGGPVVELPGDLAGWLSAPAGGAPVVFQLLDGPAMDATALRDLAARLTEIADSLTV